MLQVKKGPAGPIKIKSIRKTNDAQRSAAGSVCSIETGDAPDKPPC